jgi:hypothetical protein
LTKAFYQTVTKYVIFYRGAAARCRIGSLAVAWSQ